MKVYIDGSGWNGRRSGYAIRYEESPIPSQIVVHLEEEFTNNEMEYVALFNALLTAKEGDEILTDSQLLVGHITKDWRVNAPHLKTFVKLCKAMVKKNNIKLTWITRNENLAGKLLER